MNQSPNTKLSSHSKKDRHWESIVKDIFKIAIPIGVSVWMIVWLLGKIDIHRMDQIISSECNFTWIVAMMIISVFSHIFRGIRWGIQLRGAGLPRVSVMVESISIFGAYALNLLFPLLGETWRCLFMARKENAKISTVVGTDLADRVSDAAVIIILCGLALIVAHQSMMDFLDHYRLGERLLEFLSSPWLWIGAGVIALSIITLLIFGQKLNWVKHTVTVAKELWNSFAVIFKMKGMGEYVLLTLAIWTCYFLETYLCFFAFPFTRDLISQPGTCFGLIPGLVAFVFGSISIAIPSNGGLGPWNIAVAYSLLLFGINETDGAAFAMVVWSFKSGMLVLLGLFTVAYISISKRHKSQNSTLKESKKQIL